MKRFHLITTTEGCATNLLENATYRKELKLSGAESVDHAENADYLVVNTCGYTNEREDHSLKIIESLKAEYPGKKIVVGGCLTKINPKKLNSVVEGEFFNPGDHQGLKKILDLPTDQKASERANVFDDQDFIGLSWVHRLVIKLRPWFFKLERKLNKKFQPLHNILDSAIVNESYYCVTISQGCAGTCSFCAIKVAKGHVKSRPLVEIMHEVQKGIDNGFKKVWLLGDDIGCYGIDNNQTIADLLASINQIPADFSLVINYFEPMFFLKYFNQLKEVLADRRIININIPIQSGSSRILELMEREYDPKLVCQKINELKQENPEIVIKNNIIIGFPSETWPDFWASVKTVWFYDVNLAIPFTPRINTKAARMDGVVSQRTIFLRHKLINTVILIRHLFVFFKSFFS